MSSHKVLLAMAGAVALATSADVQPAHAACTPGGVELSKRVFTPGAKWVTCDAHVLVFQHDGNLVMYDGVGKPLWASNTWGRQANRFVVREDGNLEVYRLRELLWESKSAVDPGASVRFEEGGNLAVYGRDKTLVYATRGTDKLAKCGKTVELAKGVHGVGTEWQTCSSMRLIFQGDGNLVLYNAQGKPVWASDTALTGAGRFEVLENGNLEIYNAAKLLWQSSTNGKGSRARLEAEGYLAVYGAGGALIYSTNAKKVSSR